MLELWSINLNLYLMGAVIGQIGGVWMFVNAGENVVLALDAQREIVWQHRIYDEPDPGNISVMPHLIDLTGEGRWAVAYFVAHKRSKTHGEFRVVDARNGELIWRASTKSFYGGNRDVTVCDLDGDGVRELVVGMNDRICCFRAQDGEPIWEYDDRVHICWGRSALGDLNGDGKLEIAFGTEYANSNGTSSVVVLNHNGSLLWRYDDIPGDCGSSNTEMVDVDGDGKLEVLKSEIDLEGRTGLRRSRLWCFSHNGKVRWCADYGGQDFVVGDWEGDGELEAIGITNARDGGYGNEPEIIAIGLRDGRIKRRIKIERFWLPNWPLLADLDGDGSLELVVATGNPSGYGRIPNQPPWGDLYIVKSDGGTILQRSYPNRTLCQLAFDIDGDGRLELIVFTGDGNVICYRMM
jgi:predicted lipoprotein with Yx(FWY)xxD motif